MHPQDDLGPLPGDWVGAWADSARTAFVFEERTITYAQLATDVGRRVDDLVAQGVQPGDRVGWIGLNRVEVFELLFACARTGAVFTPFNNRLTVPELRGLVEVAAPQVVFAEGDHVGAIATALDLAGSTAPVVDIDAAAVEDAHSAPNEVPSFDAMAADPLMMVFTSGTTGRPKGAVLSHGAIVATVANGIATQGFVPDDVIVAGLPNFHVGGLNIQTLPALRAGATVVLLRRFDPTQVLDAVEQHDVTQMLLVPAMLSAISGLPRFDETDFGTVRGVMSGSSVVPAAVTEPWFARGVPVGQIYGTTETGPTAVVLACEDAADHPGSGGRVVPPGEMRIVRSDGSECEPGEPGEVLLRGPFLFSEYWRDAEATAAGLIDGWYHTGDVGHVDDDGWLFISDRLRDMLISGGENVFPAEIEAVLLESPDVAEVAVVGRPDERFGEIGVAVVVPREHSAPPTLDGIRDFLDGRLARYKHPRELVIVDSLPRTALGKVTKHVVRDRLAQR